MKTDNPIRAAAQIAGSYVALGDLLGVTPQAVRKYMKAWDAGKPVPAHRAVQIEKAVGIPRNTIRPDLWDGEYIPFRSPAPGPQTQENRTSAKFLR